MDKSKVAQPSLGAALGAPNAADEAARQSGYTAQNIGDPAVVTDGMKFVGGVITMIDDDYPYQCVCKSSRHYLSKLFNRNIPHDVEVTADVRTVLADWLGKTNHGTTTYQAESAEDAANFEARKTQAEQQLWGAASLVQSTHLAAHKAHKPSSLMQLGAHASMHRVGLALLNHMFQPADQTFSTDDGGSGGRVDREKLSKQYNNYNYRIRDGYCEKDTTQPCFPIPGLGGTLGLFIVSVCLS